MERAHPWEQLPLEVYEAHMGLNTVGQMQALNALMRSQFASYPDAVRVAVLGIAGGNGLEHCGSRTVYGVDINEAYLRACQERFGAELGNCLRLLKMDLTKPEVVLPEVDLIIADMVIEYLGLEAFCAKAANAKYISCVIQCAAQDFVSLSPYQQSFQAISTLHQDVDKQALMEGLAQFGFEPALEETVPLPNGKSFLRMDYRKRP